MVWAIVKPWLDEKTVKKISIINSGYEKDLLELIPAQNLPDFLGGQATKAEYGDYMEKEDGPWVKKSTQQEQNPMVMHYVPPVLQNV